jgi:UDP-glucose 6-dehydrogenase
VTERLYKAGATLEIYDPMVSKNRILDDIKAYWTNIDKLKSLKSRLVFLEEPKQKFEKRDIVAILTEWVEFKSYDYSQATLFDGRNLIK